MNGREGRVRGAVIDTGVCAVEAECSAAKPEQQQHDGGAHTILFYGARFFPARAVPPMA